MNLEIVHKNCILHVMIKAETIQCIFRYNLRVLLRHFLFLNLSSLDIETSILSLAVVDFFSSI